MEPKRFLYPLEQQLKFCQLETEIDFLLQQMQDIKHELFLSKNDPALLENCNLEKQVNNRLKK